MIAHFVPEKWNGLQTIVLGVVPKWMENDMDKIKIYDCSNSAERPAHLESNLGPKENDIMADLKVYCPNSFVFTNDPSEADVLITNDVFPTELLKSAKFKVKRMDGVYWHKSQMERNVPLNEAAQHADVVIFISNFSMLSYFQLYGNKLKKSVVILNNADNTIFYPGQKSIDYNWFYDERVTFRDGPNSFRLVAAATNWAREEKRWNALEQTILQSIQRDSDITWDIIGECPNKVLLYDNNIKYHGYLESKEDFAKLLRDSDAFVNLSYRDAGSKVVCQARNCGLPVIYANSGGVPEIVSKGGIAIEDDTRICCTGIDFRDNVPIISIKQVTDAILDMKADLKKYKSMVHLPNYLGTIDNYFAIIEELVKGSPSDG